jgi:hypothetical protein
MMERNRETGKNYLKDEFEAKIGKGLYKFHTIRPLNFNSLRYRDIDSPFRENIQVEESVDISLREDQYNRLIELLGYFKIQGMVDSYPSYLERRTREEQQLRNRHPALKKAFNNYQTLLRLVAEGRDVGE